MAIIDNLLAYWELNEASGNAIDAHSTHDLTDVNTVTSGTGKVGNARDFESGASEHFLLASNADVQMGDEDFTIAGWVNAESAPSSADMSVIQKTNGSDGEYFLQWRNAAGTDRFRFVVYGASGFGSEGVVTATTFGTPSIATWYFLVAWHDSVNNQLGIQVNDGTADTASHAAGVFTGTADFQMSGVTFSNFWDGLLDEIGIWGRILTAQEKTWLYNGGNGRSYSDIVAGMTAGSRRPRTRLLLGVG